MFECARTREIPLAEARDAAKIIGKKGAMIKELQEQFGVRSI